MSITTVAIIWVIPSHVNAEQVFFADNFAEFHIAKDARFGHVALFVRDFGAADAPADLHNVPLFSGVKYFAARVTEQFDCKWICERRARFFWYALLHHFHEALRTAVFGKPAGTGFGFKGVVRGGILPPVLQLQNRPVIALPHELLAVKQIFKGTAICTEPQHFRLHSIHRRQLHRIAGLCLKESQPLLSTSGLSHRFFSKIQALS